MTYARLGGEAVGTDEKLYMPQQGAADFLNLSPRTLERLRVEGRGPAFLKFGRRVMYSRKDLESWAEGTRRLSTADVTQR